ncbi:hypothetical protein HK104_007533, partial [Borealophlyctis nickersoniae]
MTTPHTYFDDFIDADAAGGSNVTNAGGGGALPLSAALDPNPTPDADGEPSTVMESRCQTITTIDTRVAVRIQKDVCWGGEGEGGGEGEWIRNGETEVEGGDEVEREEEEEEEEGDGDDKDVVEDVVEE